MKRKIWIVLAITVSLLTGCGKEAGSADVQESVPEPSSVEATATVNTEEETFSEETEESTEETEEEEIAPEHSYRSELTNEWIDESLRDQRPIAAMVDNEKTALPHYGLTEADVVYEIMNSTANDRITRFMAIVKDWGNITQFGSIRSVRPTNFMLAVEWNAVICHDGGPFYINEWVARKYTNNFSGGFARYSNGKPTEFTEYLTYDTYYNASKGRSYDGLKQRFEKSNYSTTYNEYYQGSHFSFENKGVHLEERGDAIDAINISLPFPHNRSTLKYNEDTKTYDYYEYGEAHLDPLHDDAPLTFKNVILQDVTFAQLDKNGYLIYNAIDKSRRSGYYITEGKAIEVVWEKESETALTVFYDKVTNEEIKLNTGKIYISLIPSDSWKEIEISGK